MGGFLALYIDVFFALATFLPSRPMIVHDLPTGAVFLLPLALVDGRSVLPPIVDYVCVVARGSYIRRWSCKGKCHYTQYPVTTSTGNCNCH
jgi:hypothetical protein